MNADSGKHVLLTEVLSTVMAIFRLSIRSSDRLDDLTARLDRRIANLTIAYNLQSGTSDGEGVVIHEAVAALIAPLGTTRVCLVDDGPSRVAPGVLPMLCIAIGELVDLAEMDSVGPFQSKITVSVASREGFALIEWVEDIGFSVASLADDAEPDNLQFFRKMMFANVPGPEVEWSGTRMVARFGVPMIGSPAV